MREARPRFLHLAQAAAHEAGYGVVATALGETIKGARLFKSRALGDGAWLGTTNRDRKTYNTPQPSYEASAELTTSHADTEAFGTLVPGVVVRGKGELLADAVARCPADAILIAAGAWSGLDEPRLRGKTAVIPKAPYGAPAERDNLGELTTVSLLN